MVKRVKDYEFLIYLFLKGLKEMEIKDKYEFYILLEKILFNLIVLLRYYFVIRIF